MVRVNVKPFMTRGRLQLALSKTGVSDVFLPSIINLTATFLDLVLEMWILYGVLLAKWTLLPKLVNESLTAPVLTVDSEQNKCRSRYLRENRAC